MRSMKLWVFVAMLAPGWAGAIDMDYYTYNAFEETVAAFQRVSLVLQDPGFTVFVLIFAVAGVLVGGLMVGARGMQGGQVNPIAFLIPVIVGVALFRGFVWPTGNLFVYDPVRNATQVVADVPDAVVLLAGTLNKIERGVNEIVRTASADPDSERSGALRYSLILNALNARGTDISLERNLVNYYLDCGLPSMSLGFNGVSSREAERSTADLYETFARFAHPSFSTFVFTGAGDASTTMTCSEMWATVLAPALNGVGALEEVRDTICAKSGFDIGAAPQRLRCDDELRSLGALYGMTSTSSLPFIRSSQMALAMTNALRSGDISVQTGALVNRQVIAEGMGVAEALDRWVPKVRGFMTAAVLGMVPLALLFVVTPLLGKALQLLAGLFLWLALWGIADAISVSMAVDAAADSFTQMSQYGFSHMSFMLSPEGAIQSLGVFGKARAMALMMATVLSYALFQFGGYAFTNMAQSWQSDVQQMGETAGKTALMPEERAAMMQRMTSSPGSEALVNQYGFAAVAGGGTIGPAQQAREAQRAISYISPGLNGGPDLGSVGGNTNGAEMGSMGGSSVPGGSTSGARAGSHGSSLFEGYINPRADLGTARSIAEIESKQEVADRHESSAFEVTRSASKFTDVQSTETSLTEKEISAELGFDAHKIGEQTGALSAGRTSAQGELLGQIARNEGVSPDSAIAARTVGLQERAEMIGASQAASTKQYIGAAVERTKSSVAEAEQMAQDHSAARIGEARAIDSDISARGLERTLEAGAFDRRDLIEGNVIGRMNDAARGSEVFDSGDPGEFSRAQAHLAISEQQARVDVANNLARIMGIDPTTDEGMARFTLSREGAHQTVTVAGDAGAKQHVIDALGLDARTAAAITAVPGGVSLSASIDSDGEIVYGAVTAGGQTRLLDSTTIERGFSEQAHYDYSVSGGRALVNERDVLASELARVYGEGVVGGTYDDTRLTGVANGIARYLSEGGQSMTASDFEAVVYSASARVSASGGLGFVSASASAGVERNESDQRVSQQELTFAYAREAIIGAQENAVQGFRESHSRDPLSSSDRSEVFNDMAGRIQTTMESVHRALREQTEGAEEGHDVTPPGKSLPTPPMSDPDYANYRSPISKR